MNESTEFNNTNPEDTTVNDGYVDHDVEVLPPENDNNVPEEATTPNINPLGMLGSMLGAGEMNNIPTDDVTPDPVEKTDINTQFLSLLSIGGLTFVGAAPLVKFSDDKMQFRVHEIGAIVCAA